MKAYILRCAIFVAIGLTPAVLLWTASFRMPPSYDERAVVETVLRVLNEAEDVEALAVGSSHARAIDFNTTAADGLPLALPWNDLFEVEHQLRTLVPQLPELDIVFIALSYFSFHWDNAATGDDRHLTSRRIFYAAAPSGGWVEGDQGTFLTGKAQLLGRPDLWRNVILRLVGVDPYEDQRERARMAARATRSHGELAEHARRRVAMKRAYMDVVAQQRPDVSAEAYEAIADAVRYLQEEGKLVVLYTPPYYRSYNDLFSPDPRVREMREYAQRLEREVGVPWLDFSRDPLSRQAAMFRDSDHLNRRGKREFSRKLLAVTCAEAAVRDVAGLCQ